MEKAVGAAVQGAAVVVRVQKRNSKMYSIHDTVRTVLPVLRNIFQEEHYEANGNKSGYEGQNICCERR